MAEDKIPSGVRLSPEIHAKIKYICKVNHRSFNNQMEMLIFEYIKKFEAENGPIPFDDNAIKDN